MPMTSGARWTGRPSCPPRLEAHGRIDILLNNAGVFLAAPLVETSLEDFQRVIDVNLVGVFLGMRTVTPAMSRAAGGVDHQRLLRRRPDGGSPYLDRRTPPASGRSVA